MITVEETLVNLRYQALYDRIQCKLWQCKTERSCYQMPRLKRKVGDFLPFKEFLPFLKILKRTITYSNSELIYSDYGVDVSLIAYVIAAWLVNSILVLPLAILILQFQTLRFPPNNNLQSRLVLSCARKCKCIARLSTKPRLHVIVRGNWSEFETGVMI